ncbi:MAG: type III-A CRISPR-associated RAMP protein Csm5 [Draconibacterium sp.]|nr:type III-A CRISPR-associated RAMP protein Csm5 [Draconibacterium sp.]
MNDLLNKKYNLELEVLTPLHVGAGQEKDWMKGADYIEDGNKIYILNHKKIAKEISANELSNFLVEKNDEGLKNKISRSLEEVSYKVFEKTASTDNDIKTFIKNGLTNKPIVPGSSIKGAIRSILLNYFIDNPNNIDRRDKRFEEKVFGSPNNGDEFMRFIKIADAQFDKTELVNTKIFNLYKDDNNFNGGWKKSGKQTNANFDATGFNTIYEVIKPSETGELSIALSDKAFDNFYKTSKPEKKNEILHSEP